MRRAERRIVRVPNLWGENQSRIGARVLVASARRARRAHAFWRLRHEGLLVIWAFVESCTQIGGLGRQFMPTPPISARSRVETCRRRQFPCSRQRSGLAPAPALAPLQPPLRIALLWRTSHPSQKPKLRGYIKRIAPRDQRGANPTGKGRYCIPKHCRARSQSHRARHRLPSSSSCCPL